MAPCNTLVRTVYIYILAVLATTPYRHWKNGSISRTITYIPYRKAHLRIPKRLGIETASSPVHIITHHAIQLVILTSDYIQRSETIAWQINITQLSIDFPGQFCVTSYSPQPDIPGFDHYRLRQQMPVAVPRFCLSFRDDS